ncbi:MAG: hypothetical protein ABI673_01610 [Novosphingobium sp.]
MSEAGFPAPVLFAAQLGGSLVAILILAWFARLLGLGGDVRLSSADEAKELARAALCGFDPVEVGLDRAGIGALLRDRQGRVMLLRRHGAHFAARMISDHHGARLDRNFLTLSADDARFGTITLDLGAEAGAWAGSLRRLGS